MLYPLLLRYREGCSARPPAASRQALYHGPTCKVRPVLSRTAQLVHSNNTLTHIPDCLTKMDKNAVGVQCLSLSANTHARLTRCWTARKRDVRFRPACIARSKLRNAYFCNLFQFPANITNTLSDNTEHKNIGPRNYRIIFHRYGTVAVTVTSLYSPHTVPIQHNSIRGPVTFYR